MKNQTRIGKSTRRPAKPSSPRKRAVNEKTLAPKQAPIYAYTFKDAARLSGVRLTTLRRWLLEKKITRGKDGSFNIKELLQLGIQENESRASRKPQADRARDRYWQSKAEAMEIEVKVQKGDLISYSEVLEALVERELVLKNRLLGLPTIFASQLVGCHSPGN